MPTNIEIKFRVGSLAAIEEKAAAIASSGPELIIQEDIFFPVASGRLKLRKFADGDAELIGYHRDDSDTVRESSWMAYRSTDPNQLHCVLERTLGSGLTVRKSRTLYMVDNTRIHLDHVECLGEFVELEVVLPDSQESSAVQGEEIANRLIRLLKLDGEERISVAYVDLLAGIV